MRKMVLAALNSAGRRGLLRRFDAVKNAASDQFGTEVDLLDSALAELGDCDLSLV